MIGGMGDILEKLLTEAFLVVGKGTKIDDAGVLTVGGSEGGVPAGRAEDDEKDAIVKSTKSAAFIFHAFMSSND